MRTVKKAVSVIIISCMMLMSIFMQTAYAGNDYPSKYRGIQVTDEWNFCSSNCTSFAAWCLNTRNNVRFHNHFGGRVWGHANQWGHTARALGYTVDKNPAVGSIAWWENDRYGHVAWVSAVNGANVTIEEYNFRTPLGYGERVSNQNNPAGYIHIQDLKAAEPEKPKPIEGNYYSDPSLEDGEYIIETSIRDNIIMTSDGKYIFVKQNLGWDIQVWKLTRLSDGTFKVLCKGYDNVMDVYDGRIGNEIDIISWTWNDGANQHWYIVKNSDGTYSFFAKHSGYALDVKNGVLEEGPDYYGKLWQYNPNGTKAQKFRLKRVDKPVYKEEEYNPKKENPKYTVTFKDYDGRTISSQTVEKGNSAITPASPYREGYQFNGWDREYFNVTSNLTVYAKYIKLENNEANKPKDELGKDVQKENPKYTVIFKDYDGRTISSQTVEKGNSAITPASPYRKGYQFTGWDREYSNVASDLTVYAKYTKLESDDTYKPNDESANNLQEWNPDKYDEAYNNYNAEVGKPEYNLRSLPGLKYSAKITAAQMQEALENLDWDEDSGDGVLNLDLSTISGDFKSLNISMSKETFGYMVDGDIQSFIIKLPINQLMIDGNAMEEIYNNANGRNITFIIKKTVPKVSKKAKKSAEYKNLYTLDIKVGKKRIKKLSNGGIYAGNLFYKLNKKELRKHLIWFK